jgi:hypothetical protein
MTVQTQEWPGRAAMYGWNTQPAQFCKKRKDCSVRLERFSPVLSTHRARHNSAGLLQEEIPPCRATDMRTREQ